MLRAGTAKHMCAARRRPSHLIPQSDVRGWLRGSAVTWTTAHCTDWDSAQDILSHGVDVLKCEPFAGWGQGFYSSTRPWLEYGPAEVRVAIRLLRPLIIRDTVRGAELLDELMRNTGHLDDARAAVRAAGYDGVILHYPFGEIWVVAFENDQVNVVADDD